MKAIAIITLLLAITTCSLAQQNTAIVMLPQQMQPPVTAKKLGTVTSGNNSTKVNCDYDEVINDLKKKAATLGGNIIKITQLEPPAFISKCYKVKADVYSVPDITPYLPKAPETQASPVGNNFATIYFYRLKDSLAIIATYHVHLNGDSVVYNSRSKSKDSIRIYTEGPLNLWAHIERRAELNLNIRFGRQYYVRCGLEKGEVRMTPVLEAVDNTLGQVQYNSITSGSRNADINYLKEIH